MSLVRCPECGKEISDKSKNCIHCGYPLIELKRVEEQKVTTHMWRCSKCGNLINLEPCKFCEENSLNSKDETASSNIDYIDISSTNNIENTTVQNSSSIKKESTKKGIPWFIVVTGSIIMFFALIIIVALALDNKSTTKELDPNRTHEKCSIYGETRVFGYEHTSRYDCISDGDGCYYPTFGHHHHK